MSWLHLLKEPNGALRVVFPSALFLISPLRGPSWQATYCSRLSAPMPVCMYVRCSPPVISFFCLRLRQPASSPATSQPTSTGLLLGQQLSRGYFFCFSHLLSFILLSVSSLVTLFLPFHSIPFLPIWQICLSDSRLTTAFLSLLQSLSLTLLITNRLLWCFNTSNSHYKFIKKRKLTQSEVSYISRNPSLCYWNSFTTAMPWPVLIGVDIISPPLIFSNIVSTLHYIWSGRASLLPLAFKGSEISLGQPNVILPASLLKGLWAVCVCVCVCVNKQELQTASLGKHSKTEYQHGSWFLFPCHVT